MKMARMRLEKQVKRRQRRERVGSIVADVTSNVGAKKKKKKKKKKPTGAAGTGTAGGGDGAGASEQREEPLVRD